MSLQLVLRLHGCETGGSLPVNVVHASREHVIVYLVLNMWPAYFGLPVILLAVTLSKEIRRHATFINLCVVYILIGMVFTGSITGPQPPPLLCFFQAVLIAAMPPLQAMERLEPTIYMFFGIKGACTSAAYLDEDHGGRLWIMIILPYVGYFATMIAAAIVGSNNLSHVSRDRRVFYCSLKYDPLSNTTVIITGLVLSVTIALEVWSIVLLVRFRKVAHAKGTSVRGTLDLSFVIRAFAFGSYNFAALLLCFLSISSPSTPIPDLVIGTGTTLVTFIFGTQIDILRALCFWKSWQRPVAQAEPDLRDDLSQGSASDTERKV
ncbi:hypothetical protein FA15DRAFT_582694 [Coprinopsis marcescibilis]|uniref:G-protein coupled receptors family 1 profile domain-containing protein n=1 Tax=Coprinopsis marcescibilis TaxID=230819 RepID=A0A5C3L8A1_COPMA|nr:hypothetical protein FA15DRAFT_582694 [Coprinopsis marcescibilis]